MDVLIGCEYSGIVRNAFIKRGHNAISCDLEDTESPRPHHKGDIFDFLNRGNFYDIGIFHPECKYMACCGNRWYSKTRLREEAIIWTIELYSEALKWCNNVCFENPRSVLWKPLNIKPQYIQPWQFGHPETKATGLGLYNLPDLKPTKDVFEYMMTLPKKERHKVWYASPSPTRGKDRSKFYPGIADAMAEQWG